MAIGGALLARVAEKPCRVFGSELRVRVPATGLVHYPTSRSCAESSGVLRKRTSTVVNRTVVIEALSESTAKYDRGEKLEQ